MKGIDIDKWKETRDKGLVRFIILRGMVSCGIPMMILFGLANAPFLNGWFSMNVLVHLLIGLCTGAVFGLTLWFAQEYRYKKALRTNAIAS